MAIALLLPFALPANAAVSQLETVLHRLSAKNAPDQYSANVQLHVHLRSFPWISETLNGTEQYRSPGVYHYEFPTAPSTAQQLSNMVYDLGDVNSWPSRYNVSLLTPPSNGVDPVVRLAAKAPKLVKTLDVTVNMASGLITKAVWTRVDGGSIVMTQKYAPVAAHEVVAEQDASIRIPHMSADLTATYNNFNVSDITAKHR